MGPENAPDLRPRCSDPRETFGNDRQDIWCPKGRAGSKNLFGQGKRPKTFTKRTLPLKGRGLGNPVPGVFFLYNKSCFLVAFRLCHEVPFGYEVVSRRLSFFTATPVFIRFIISIQMSAHVTTGTEASPLFIKFMFILVRACWMSTIICVTANIIPFRFD